MPDSFDTDLCLLAEEAIVKLGVGAGKLITVLGVRKSLDILSIEYFYFYH